MMSDRIQIFEHKRFGSIRILTRDGEPWFVGNDICETLGYAKPRNAIKKYVDEDDALKWGVIDRLGRNQKTTIIVQFSNAHAPIYFTLFLFDFTKKILKSTSAALYYETA